MPSPKPHHNPTQLPAHLSEKAGAGPLISAQELEMLLTHQERNQRLGVDPGFKWRMNFMLVALLVFIGLMLISPGFIYGKLQFENGANKLAPVLPFRGYFVLGVLALYYFSYWRDWYFERVALITFALALSSLFMDFFNVLGFSLGPIPPLVVVFLLLRLLIIYCLFMNAIHANRAPPAPRAFWRWLN